MQNDRTLSPVNAGRLIKAMIEMKRPVFLHGSPGIGKSDIIRQIGEDLGRPVIDIRLLLMSEIDLRGMPYLNKETNEMVWAPPVCIPLHEDSNAIIFFDELTQAPPSLQAAALQLILDRQIGEFKLPEGVSMVAAGNRASDKTGAKPLIKALANRFLHINVESKFNDWQTYAINAGVHPDVVGFLSHKPHYLNNFDPSSPDNSFATPRSWVFFVSDILKDKNFPEDLLRDAISGSVGEALSIEFMALRKIMADLPKPDDILNGKITKMKNKEIAAQYSLVTSVIYRLKEMQGEVDNGDLSQDDWYNAADRFMAFATDQLEAEITVMALSISISQMKLRFNHVKMPSYKEFFTKYSSLLRGVYDS